MVVEVYIMRQHNNHGCIALWVDHFHTRITHNILLLYIYVCAMINHEEQFLVENFVYSIPY